MKLHYKFFRENLPITASALISEKTTDSIYFIGHSLYNKYETSLWFNSYSLMWSWTRKMSMSNVLLWHCSRGNNVTIATENLCMFLLLSYGPFGEVQEKNLLPEGRHACWQYFTMLMNTNVRLVFILNFPLGFFFVYGGASYEDLK